MARILLIEDNDKYRRMLSLVFQREGHEIVEAQDGMVGLDLFRRQPVDLIITDIFMPEKEGIETIMDIKKESPDVKIIAISGGGRMGDTGVLQAAENLGADRTFTKPFEISEMLETIRDLLAE